MSLGQFFYYARIAIEYVLLLAAPPLIIGLVIGLIISILQATTSIQDQTLSLVPKIVAVFVSLIIFGPWILTGLETMAYFFLSEIPSMGK